MRKYEIIIYWSNEDDTYVAAVPELPGCRPTAQLMSPLPQTLTRRFNCGLILLKNSAIRFRNRRDNG